MDRTSADNRSRARSQERLLGMLHAEAATSNTSLRSQNTVRGQPELKDDAWTAASLRASLSGEYDAHIDADITVEVDTKAPDNGDSRTYRRSQSVDLPRPFTPITTPRKVMINKDRDVSLSVLSDSGKSVTSRRKSWVSPLRLLERVKSKRSWGSPGANRAESGSGYGSPQKKAGKMGH